MVFGEIWVTLIIKIYHFKSLISLSKTLITAFDISQCVAKLFFHQLRIELKRSLSTIEIIFLQRKFKFRTENHLVWLYMSDQYFSFNYVLYEYSKATKTQLKEVFVVTV